MKKNYQRGDIITMTSYPLMNVDMIIVGEEETLKGWKYQLAFLTKKGTVDRKRSHRFFYEDRFTKKKNNEVSDRTLD